MWSGLEPDAELFASGRVLDDDGEWAGAQALDTPAGELIVVVDARMGTHVQCTCACIRMHARAYTCRYTLVRPHAHACMRKHMQVHTHTCALSLSLSLSLSLAHSFTTHNFFTIFKSRPVIKGLA